MTTRTCRFCGEDDQRLVKYGVRHYAHALCLYRAGGMDALQALPLAEIERLPVLAMQDVGVDVLELHRAVAQRSAGGRTA